MLCPRVPVAESGARCGIGPRFVQVDSISVAQQTGAQIVARSWARVRAGTYKNDLCWVDSITAASEHSQATVKLIPRLDYHQMASREKAPLSHPAPAPHARAAQCCGPTLWQRTHAHSPLLTPRARGS